MRLWRTGLLAALTLGLAACTAAPAAPPAAATPSPAASGVVRTPKKVTFMAGFKAQADLPFVAAYVAQEKGFFKEQALEVEIRHSAGQGEHTRLLAAGQIQFTTGTGDGVVTQVAEQDAPWVAIAVFGQKSDNALAVLEDSNIRTPKDWEGKVVGFKTRPSPEYLAILKAAGVDRSKITEVAVGFDPRILVERRVDVYPVFASNEPDVLARQGIRTRLFTADQYGLRTMGLTYITTRDYLKADPDAAERFLRATLYGLQWAFDNEEAALDIVMKYAPQEDREHQRYLFRTEKAEAQSELTQRLGLGWQTADHWQSVADSLLEYGVIKKPIDVRTLFDDTLLKRIYRDGKIIWP